LSRRHRFTTRGSFGPALQGGRKVRGRFAVLHLAPRAGSPSRLGVALTRRLVPSAVQRNQVKRLVREAFRRHGLKAAGFDCVITLRSRLAPAERAAAIEEISGLLDQALQRRAGSKP
jgi:ribonuclease P protein component